MVFARGIILEKKEHKEADWRYIAFTRELGKIEFISRGGRRVLARLSGHMEPLTLTDLEFTMSNTLKVIGASGVDHFYAIKEDPVLFSHAWESIQFINHLLPFHYHDEALFDTLHTYLIKMNVLGKRKESSGFLKEEHLFSHTYTLLKTYADVLGVTPELQFDMNAVQLEQGGVSPIRVLTAYFKNHLKNQF